MKRYGGIDAFCQLKEGSLKGHTTVVFYLYDILETVWRQ